MIEKNSIKQRTVIVTLVIILRMMIMRYIQRQFCKKGALRNFANFTGKQLCQSLFFIKVACVRPVTLSKKRLWHRCFPVNFAKFLRTSFSQNTSRQLLVNYKSCENYISFFLARSSYYLVCRQIKCCDQFSKSTKCERN